MSHLKYYAYKGVGERQQANFRYSQAVRVGDRIECAGQGKKCYICMNIASLHSEHIAEHQ